jgi:hypothetical protein
MGTASASSCSSKGKEREDELEELGIKGNELGAEAER